MNTLIQYYNILLYNIVNPIKKLNLKINTSSIIKEK